MRIVIQDTGPGSGRTLEYFRIYTEAFVAAGLPPVVSVAPLGVDPKVVELTVRAPSIEYASSGEVGPRGRSWHPASPGPATAAALRALGPRTRTEVEIAAGDRCLTRLPLLVLDAWEWPHEAAARTLSAVYVLPGDRTVARLVSDAHAPGEFPVVSRGSPEETPDSLRQRVFALYRHLADQWTFLYEPPRVDVETLTGQTHQRVHSPQEVVTSLADRQGRGNCLDLTLLFAGCFESLGLQPLLCFVGEPDRAPVHVFCGVWTARARRFKPILAERAAISRWLTEGRLLVFESTGICRGGTRLDPAAAEAAARERVFSGEPLHLLDVAAARPPAGVARPLDLDNDPPVQRALWRAQTAARAAGSPHLEALHLLLGLCGPETGLTRSVLAGVGSTPERVHAVIESRRSSSEPDVFPVPTQNFELCWSAAREYARSRGAARVEEIDLLWAVTESPSRNIKRALAAAGCEIHRVVQELESRGGRPGVTSLSVELMGSEHRFDPEN